MKANELMIGDWVNIYVFPNDEPKGDALFPARINAILGDGEDVECRFALNGEGKVGYASRPAGTCLPIPLTPEILEKNGFEKQSDYQWKYRDNGCKIVISIAPQIEIDGEILGTPPINVILEGALFDINMTSDICVHNLQHALRLCGIDKTFEL